MDPNLDPLPEPPGVPAAPEFGFNPLAIFATVKAIQADIAILKAFWVKIAPIIDEIRAALGKAAPAGAQMTATAAAESLKSPPNL